MQSGENVVHCANLIIIIDICNSLLLVNRKKKENLHFVLLGMRLINYLRKLGKENLVKFTSK